MRVLPSRYFGRATGQHRKPPAPVPGAIVGQEFRQCGPCGVETVVVVHGDGSTSCTENHAVVPGDPT